jgi:hypothetical protein
MIAVPYHLNVFKLLQKKPNSPRRETEEVVGIAVHRRDERHGATKDAPGLQRSSCFADNPARIWDMLQQLAHDDRVDRSVPDRQIGCVRHQCRRASLADVDADPPTPGPPRSIKRCLTPPSNIKNYSSQRLHDWLKGSGKLQAVSAANPEPDHAAELAAHEAWTDHFGRSMPLGPRRGLSELHGANVREI